MPASTLGRRLSLKPYGNELLTSSGDLWIFSARLIIVAMALAEAMAWGYMGSLMSQAYPWVAAAVAAAFIFLLIWIIDTSFMTLDTARAHYDRVLTGRKSNSGRESFKLAAGVVARIAIVTASLLITAPFLAQAIFSADVRAEMEQRNAATVATARSAIAEPFAARLDRLRGEQTALEQERVREAAGVGASGRYGRGPALETIELQLVEKRQEIAAAEAAQAAELARFDALSPEGLERQHGIALLTPGIRTNTLLLETMLQNPEFARAERAVKAFLAFLFLGLLILKFFQPASISIYFSERLHSLWDEYQKGIFDSYLPEQERASTGGRMDPLRFEDWCVSTYALIRDEEQQRRARAHEQRIHQLRIDEWQQLEQATRAEVEPLLAHRENLRLQLRTIETALDEARAASHTATEELQRAETLLRSMQQQIDRGGMDGPTFSQAMKTSQDLRERRDVLTAALRGREADVQRITRQLDTLRADLESAERELTAKRSLLEALDQRIRTERLAHSDRVSESAKLLPRDALT